MGKRRIPNVEDTDLTRQEMEAVANDLGVDPEDYDDQALLEQLGVALGELNPADLDAAADSVDEDDGGTGGDETGDEQTAAGEPVQGMTRDELRDRLRELGLPVGGTKNELAERLAEADD